MTTPPPRKLTNRQQAFINAYIETWNATEAARRAGYNGESNVVGPRMLVNVGIQAAIAERMREQAMTADEVLTRLRQQAQANVSEFFNAEHELDWDVVKAKGHLIKTLARTSAGGWKLELYSAQEALGIIGKAHALFTEKQNVTVTIRESDVDAALSAQLARLGISRETALAEMVDEAGQLGEDSAA